MKTADQEAEPGKGAVVWGHGKPGHGLMGLVFDRTLRPGRSRVPRSMTVQVRGTALT